MAQIKYAGTVPILQCVGLCHIYQVGWNANTENTFVEVERDESESDSEKVRCRPRSKSNDKFVAAGQTSATDGKVRDDIPVSDDETISTTCSAISLGDISVQTMDCSPRADPAVAPLNQSSTSGNVCNDVTRSSVAMVPSLPPGQWSGQWCPASYAVGPKLSRNQRKKRDGWTCPSCGEESKRACEKEGVVVVFADDEDAYACYKTCERGFQEKNVQKEQQPKRLERGWAPFLL